MNKIGYNQIKIIIIIIRNRKSQGKQKYLKCYIEQEKHEHDQDYSNYH